MKKIGMLVVALLLVLGVLSANGVMQSHFRFSMRSGTGGDEDEGPGPDSARVALFLADLRHTDATICEQVTDAVGNSWHWGSEEGAVGLLSDVSPSLEAQRDSLSHPVRDPRALKLLGSTLSDPSPCIRRLSARLLGRSDHYAAEYLRAGASDAAVRTREAAIYGMGTAGDTLYREDIERAAKDGQPPVVAMAAWALGASEDRRAVAVLVRLLTHSDARVRRSAAWALGKTEDKNGVEPLVARLRDDDALVRTLTAESLGELESKVAVSALMAVEHDADARVRRAVVEALGHLEDRKATEVLIGATEDQDTRVRIVAAEALGHLQDSRSAGPLARLLQDKSIKVRRAAVEALGNLEELHTAPTGLLDALRSGDRELRRGAAEALQHIGDPRTIAALGSALQHSDRETRRAVVHALGGIDNEDVTPFLIQALKDADAEVRKAAADALGERRGEKDSQ